VAGGWEWPPPQNPKTTRERSASQGPVRPRLRGVGISEDPHIYATVWQGACNAGAQAPPFGKYPGTRTARYAASWIRTSENSPSTHFGA
jgi:hypothetical protein